MPNRQQTPDQQPKDRRGPVTTTPDDDEVQGNDPTRAGDQNDPQRARRRDQNPDLEQDQVTQVEDEEAEEDEDEEDGRGPRS